MKNEVKRLKEKALNSLLLCVEHFNRPWDTGRDDAVLILMGHACEMLLKAGILHRGGEIRRATDNETIGFEACVNKALSDSAIKFLSENHAVTLRIIGGLRNSAQHYYRDIREELLYICTHDGVDVFRHVFHVVFKEDLKNAMPDRVLPISTVAPKDILALFSEEIEEIKGIINSESRRKSPALSKLRNLDIVENALTGKQKFMNDRELKKTCQKIGAGNDWTEMFPGIANIRVSSDAQQIVQLKWSNKEGVPVRKAKEGEQGALLVTQHLSKFQTHPFGLRPLARKLEMSEFRALALIHHLKIQDEPKYFVIEHTPGKKMAFKLYSAAALNMLREYAKTVDWDDVLDKYQKHQRRKKQQRKHTR